MSAREEVAGIHRPWGHSYVRHRASFHTEIEGPRRPERSDSMAEVASAFVSILPSTRGFGTALEGDIGADVDRVGKSAGGRFGSVFGTALKLAGSLRVSRRRRCSVLVLRWSHDPHRLRRLRQEAGRVRHRHLGLQRRRRLVGAVHQAPRPQPPRRGRAQHRSDRLLPHVPSGCPRGQRRSCELRRAGRWCAVDAARTSTVLA